jgi:hypothetical protein
MNTTKTSQPLALGSTEGLGPLPPQREGQYLTMTICGTNDDPAECGHWSSPAHVQWRIDKAVAAERARCAAIARRWGETHADGVTVNARNAASKIARGIEGPNVRVQPAPTGRA